MTKGRKKKAAAAHSTSCPRRERGGKVPHPIGKKKKRDGIATPPGSEGKKRGRRGPTSLPEGEERRYEPYPRSDQGKEVKGKEEKEKEKKGRALNQTFDQKKKREGNPTIVNPLVHRQKEGESKCRRQGNEKEKKKKIPKGKRERGFPLIKQGEKKGTWASKHCPSDGRLGKKRKKVPRPSLPKRGNPPQRSVQGNEKEGRT